MDNMDLEVLRQVQQWHTDGRRVVLGTITRTWGSSPRPVGSVVAVRGDGQIAGSVSGGCIEDDLVAKIKDGALALDAPQVTRYGVGAEAAQAFGLPCGGLLELVLEPVGAHSQVSALLEILARGECVRRELDLASGVVTLMPPGEGDLVQLTEKKLVTTHGPHWRLLIIGAGQMTQYLAQMARALDYQVVVCDPREEYVFELPGVRLLRGMPDDVVSGFKPDAHTAIIALTHDPKLDDLALMEALNSEAFYVGAIGSRTNQDKRKQRLAEHFDVTDTQLARLHGPVGIKNGARTPPEIAVAILAQLTAERYGYRIPEPIPPAANGTAPDEGCALP